ncbi:hypothetical protein WICMUC_005381 [Wickerhamomyces mucosus]|uniref:Mannosyltransferase n=1 Tax=Wickerhamomyces mucosus TaxID=1378264 RepID=A0A9P8P9A2_9ASCO|nr:hypothetical protein WICMUC_005381 [Wickerhamomyces mucosus]
MELNKKAQKLLFFTVAFLLVITTFNYHHHVISPELHESISQNAKYYSDQLSDIYHSSYSSNSETEISSEKERIFESLNQPAFKSDGKSPKQIMKDNTKFVRSLLAKPIEDPKLLKLVQKEEFKELENATFVSLVRNSELNGIIKTIKQIEETFNDKFHYPYTFLNDQPFTENFKSSILKEIPGSQVHFAEISSSEWDKPSFIDEKLETRGIKELEEVGVGYAGKLSYHNMCRYYSKGFYNHPILKEFKYYWRIEPSTNYFCQIDYDVFKFMKDNNKVYGFVLNLYDSPHSVKSLWNETLRFLKNNTQHINENGAHKWITENLQNPSNFEIAKGYSTCHFWSNFEIGDMDFYRSEAYSSWVEHLDKTGGFYYERWGDAPVHSIGLGLFADKSQIHWFRDIGYEHTPYLNCPNSNKCNTALCPKGKFSRFNGMDSQNCLATWAKYEMTDEQLNNY